MHCCPWGSFSHISLEVVAGNSSAYTPHHGSGKKKIKMAAPCFTYRPVRPRKGN